MTFDDFKAWFDDLNARLDGKPPAIEQWWELKARLDVLAKPDIVMQHENISSRSAKSSILASKPAVSCETSVEDMDPGDFADDPDGGITRQAVRTLKEAQSDLRPTRGARTPTP